MRVIRLDEVAPAGESGRRRKVAVGTFDGVHRGHREVIRGSDTVLTFDPHPVAVIKPDAAPKLITPLPIKRDLIAGLGVDELVTIPFDREFAGHSAEWFVEEVLVRQLGAEEVSVGENFRFGKGAQGDAAFLQVREEFRTRVVPLVEVAGETVSSSMIRALVAAGEVRKATDFLGGPFLLEGVVARGDRRGRQLGMRTANLVPEDGIVCPGHGVYAAWAHGYPAAVSVGVAPTFDTGRGVLIEAHLIGFEDDLYGQVLRIAFLERMRGERRFDSPQALVEQMEEDVRRAAEICQKPSALSSQPPVARSDG